MSWYTDNLGPFYEPPNISYIKINTPPSFSDYIREEYNKLQMRATLYDDYILPSCEIKKILKKETIKMEAKKCDRCGKLYEMPGARETNGADVRFKHMRISGAEDMSGSKIAEKQTKRIWIKAEYDGDVDLCPDCRKSLKKWFESTDKEDKKNG